MRFGLKSDIICKNYSDHTIKIVFFIVLTLAGSLERCFEYAAYTSSDNFLGTQQMLYKFMKRHVRSLYSKIGAWLLLDFSVGCLLCLINSQDGGLMQHLHSFACCLIFHAFFVVCRYSFWSTIYNSVKQFGSRSSPTICRA